MYSYDREVFLERLKAERNSELENRKKKDERWKQLFTSSTRQFPFHLVPFILEFYELGMWGNNFANDIVFRSFNRNAKVFMREYKKDRTRKLLYRGIIKGLYGYFQNDKFRKPFLIFRTIDACVYLSALPKKIRCFKFSPYADTLILEDYNSFPHLQKMICGETFLGGDFPMIPETVREIAITSTNGLAQVNLTLFKKLPRRLKSIKVVGYNLNLIPDQGLFANFGCLEKLYLQTTFTHQGVLEELPISLKEISLISNCQTRMILQLSKFRRFVNLRTLYLKDIQLTGQNELPEHLEHLNLDWINFSALARKVVMNKKLKTFEVFMANFCSVDTSKMFCFDNVEEMDYINLKSGQFSFFPKKRVKRLAIRFWSRIRKDAVFPEKVDEFVISDCKDMEIIAKKIQRQVKEIDQLSFENSECQISVTTIGWSHLKDVRCVKCVKFCDWTMAAGGGLNSMYYHYGAPNLPINIRAMKFCWIKFQESILKSVREYKGLEEIEIFHNVGSPSIDESDVLAMLLNLPRLKRFKVRQNANLTYVKRTPFNFEVFRNNEVLKERSVVLDLENDFEILV